MCIRDRNRTAFKKGEITLLQYKEFNKKKIKECIEFQEEIGLDVLVHGEYERNDMVEYFGEFLSPSTDVYKRQVPFCSISSKFTRQQLCMCCAK